MPKINHNESNSITSTSNKCRPKQKKPERQVNTFRLLCFVALAIATQSCGGFLQTAIHDSGTREEEDDDDNVAPSLIFEETAASVLLGYPIEINPIKNLGGKIENCTIEPDVTQITGLLFNTQTCAISGSATHSIAPTLYTVTAQNQNGSHQIQFSFGVRPVVSIEETLVNVSASTLSLGQTISVVVQTKNSSGANLSSGGAIVELSLSGGTSQGSFSQVVDIGDGTYTAIFTGSTPGTATSIKATIDGFGQVLDSKLITVLPGAISNTQSTVGITSGTITSGTTSSVILQAKDAAGNNISSFGADVVFSLTGAGTSSGTFSVVTDHEDGTYSAVFTGTTAGTAKTISATINGDLATSTSSVTVNVGSISTATSTVTSSADTIVSGSTSTVTLQAKDAAGNNLLSGEADVVFSLTGAGTSSGTFSVVTDHEDGTYSAIFTGTTAGDAKTISATINTVTVSDTSEITVNPGTASKLVFTAEDSSLTTDTCSSILTLQLQDSNNNVVTQSGSNRLLTLSSAKTGGGSLTGSTTYFSNSSCNVPIADPETDFFISVGVSSASFYIKHSHEENITLTVASDTLTSATSNISIANPIAFNCEDSPPDISFTCGTTTVRMDLLMDCYWCHEAGAGEMYWDEIDNNFKLEISELAAQCDGPVSCSKSGPSPFGSYCNGDIMVTDNYSAPCPDAQTPCTSWLNHDAQYLIEGQFTDIDSETGECMAPQAFWAIVKGPADPNDFSCSYQSMQIQDRSDNIAYASLSLSCGSWDINIASGATATTSKRTGANPIGSYTADVSSCDPDAPSAGLSGVTVVIDP